jgi:hypothetical protein
MTMATVVFMLTQSGRLFGGSGDLDLDLGDGVYRSGIPAAELAPAIEREGPFLLPDLAGGDSDIFLQHLGPDDTDGWLAIAARPPTAARDCLLEWVPDDATFVDSCDGTVYPADGEGLPRYPVQLDAEGNLEVDLNVVLGPSTAG